MACDCKSCTDSRRWDGIVERSDVSEMKELITELSERLRDTEADNDYFEAVMNGSWPSAKEIGIGIVEKVLARELAASGKTLAAERKA